MSLAETRSEPPAGNTRTLRWTTPVIGSRVKASVHRHHDIPRWWYWTISVGGMNLSGGPHKTRKAARDQLRDVATTIGKRWGQR